jgi:hypothetical protein
MQATMKELSHLASPAPGFPPTLLIESVQSPLDMSVCPSRLRALLDTLRRPFPHMSAHLSQWLSDWARTQLDGTGEGLTWNWYAHRKPSSTEGRVPA